MLGVANAAYLEGFPFPALLSVAPYCARGGIRVVSGGRGLRVARSFANQMWQALEGPPHRQSKDPMRDFNLRVALPFPFIRSDIHEGLTREVLTSSVEPGQRDHQAGVPGDPCSKLDTDFEKVLPRPRVNRLCGRCRTSPDAIIEQWVRGVGTPKGP